MRTAGRCTASARSISTYMGPASGRTRSRGFRSCRAEAICASYGAEPSRPRSNTSPRTASDVELGPVRRAGARGDGTSVYFRAPDGGLLELIAYR